MKDEEFQTLLQSRASNFDAMTGAAYAVAYILFRGLMLLEKAKKEHDEHTG